MRYLTISSVLCGLAAFACAGCNDMSRSQKDEAALMRPQDDLDFDRLYSQNCSACHGRNGRDGPALDLANPVYQAVVDDASLTRWIVRGVPGTQMPAFGESAGGLLTENQVDALVAGMRKSWARGVDSTSLNAPSYLANQPGDAGRGAGVYQSGCASCHRQAREQITDTSYLALVSDQALRTIVIAGRPDLGHPDWRHDVADHPLTNQDVTDVVTYLGSLRSATPGQPYPEPR